jgi:acetyl-CoA acetyltransferase
VVLLARGERARDLRQWPARIASMQGTRAGREEFIFAPRRLGINQQSGTRTVARAIDREVFAQAGVTHGDVHGFYTYDAFSPLVLFALERFGYCGPGEAAAFVQAGRIELTGALPVNTSGGLLSEAHVAGWNSICEMVRQLRGTAGPTQIPHAQVLHWGTAWGDSVMLTL